MIIQIKLISQMYKHGFYIVIIIIGIVFILCVTVHTPRPVALQHPGREKVEINPQVCLLCFHSPSIMG